MRVRSLIVALLASALATAAVAGPWTGTLRGLSLDTLVWLRGAVLGPQHARTGSPTVVIAIDEETYRREPFSTTPKVMWTNEFATVIDAVAAGGAAVVAMDVILPTTVASHIRGFDRAFLQSLRRHSREGRVVLSKVQHSAQPILPAAGQRFAVGHAANIRAANLYSDAEGIVRGVPVTFALADGGHEPSLALELAARVLGDRLDFDADGHARRDGAPLPTVAGNNMLINFDDDQRGIPTFSLADMHACAVAGDTGFFERHFAGRVVLVGAVLDVEDRKLSSMRFATAPDGAAFGERCTLAPLEGLHDAAITRDSVPGVYIHGFAVNNLVRGNLLADAGPALAIAATFALALVVSLAGLWAAAWVAGLVAVGLAGLWAVVALGAYQSGWVVPLFDPPIAAAIAFALTVAYRFTVADRDKRMLRQMFGLYLAPSVIEQMVERSEMPALGGETRELTVYFSDLAGFTSLSEGMSPEALVKLLNDYLSAMTETIEAHGGFVDKYIGDAIVAAFGAPHHDTAHADNAVAAAIECQRRLDALNPELGLPPDKPLRQRVGINTGPILVGNIGSTRRFNYTVMGDAVNLAARLEGANKFYGTAILVSDATRARCGDAIRFREIDRVRVVGRDEPVTLFTPVAGDTAPATLDVYASALAEYQAGGFDAAASAWAEIEKDDPPAAAMCARARQFAAGPPARWDGVYDLDAK